MNFTQEKGAVSEERHGYGAKPGHDIAVFEIIDQGMQFVGMVKEGEQFQPKKKGLFGPAREYASYAVNSTSTLNFKFTQRFDHMSASHFFDLTFYVRYGVSSPALIVTKLSHDPLGKLRDEIKETLGGAITRLPWADIFQSKLANNFSTLPRQIIQGPEFERLEKFAAEYGIELKSIEISLDLSAEDAEPLKKKASFNRKEEIADIDNEGEKAMIAREQDLLGPKVGLEKAKLLYQKELERVKNQTELEKTVVSILGKTLGEVASGIQTPEALSRGMEIIWQAFQGIPGPDEGRPSGMPPGLASSSPVAMLGAGSQNGHMLATVLDEAMRRFGARKAHPFERDFLANLLHWIAENYRMQRADAKLLNDYRAALVEGQEKIPNGVDSESFTWLQRLLDQEDLQARLA
ncbi:MAG: hypothetical protein LAO76_26955 [Acidobacteriia bacterium]|nr:hypothetical protein [Terriglobia bacterium]